MLGGRAVIEEFEVTGGRVVKRFELGAALSESVKRRVIKNSRLNKNVPT